MNASIVLIVLFLTTAGMLIFAPLLSPKQFFFGVRVPPGFRSTEPAQQALRRHRIMIGIASVLGVVWILFWPGQFGAAVFPPLLLSVVSVLSGIWNYRALCKYQISPPTATDVELTTEPDRLPRFFWLAMIPPAILVGTALYLHLHWAEIPMRYPVHWGINGQPNGWSTRSVRGVYGPLIFAGLWMAWFVAMALVSWYYSRRSPLRTAMAKVMIAAEFLFGVLWPFMALSSFHQPNPGLMALVSIGGAISMVVFSLATFSSASSEAGNELNAGMSSGRFCYNRNDPSLLVPRIDGLGYAPNFAHPAAWVLLLAPFAIVLVGLKFIF